MNPLQVVVIVTSVLLVASGVFGRKKEEKEEKEEKETKPAKKKKKTKKPDSRVEKLEAEVKGLKEKLALADKSNNDDSQPTQITDEPETETDNPDDKGE